MAQVEQFQKGLRTLLIEHQEVFETLADHENDEIAALFGEFPLELIDNLPADDAQNTEGKR